MSCRQNQRDDLDRFKHSLRSSGPPELEAMLKSLGMFVTSLIIDRDRINADRRTTNKKIRIVRELYLEKTGMLPVKEYSTNGVVRYRLQSLIHNQCLLSPEHEWFILSRRYNQAREFSVVMSLPRNISAAKVKYDDRVRSIRRKRVACDSIPISLMLLREGAKLVYVESLFPRGRGAVRTVSHSTGVLWVGRLVHGKAEDKNWA
jgi:hypothetical protein